MRASPGRHSSASFAPDSSRDGAQRGGAFGGAVDLVAAAHGTADPRGIREVHALVRLMAEQRPGVPISLGFVDVDLPALPSLIDRVVADGKQATSCSPASGAPSAVVVPLLLSSGYHTAVDIAREADRRPYQVQAAAALGPDPALADVLVDRLLDCVRLRGIDRVVLAAAGSSDRRALLDCSATAALLSERIDRPVEIGYVSGAGERLGPVLARSTGKVAVATYLLAPGFFADRVRWIAAGRPVSAPLGADPRIAALALHRYDVARKMSVVAV
ncbi:sirohydrochlorin chelatase [Streptomyces sp. SID13031]|uniref:sirohydrochlorin chelatase n=1 Tax=Streptomyces sp. SID13031 TaxID=2706046 RepID=UPI0013CBD62D|nr:sirohydrochlorin chelatase [Streptomyces sp. SID13031]NEA36539.1 sirohydrochlorin chelatase [Streptomyces sp. SID13031]